MVQNLPEESALNRAVNGWTTSQFLLADILDSSRFGRWEYGQSMGGENQQPKPVPRPYQEDSKDIERQKVRAAHDAVMARLKGGQS